MWKIPLPLLPTVISGALLFLLGSYFFIKWELFWERTYRGQLVKTGYFRYVRHPHYASLLLIGFGLSLFFYSLVALLISFIALPIMICSILDEEKELIEKYGDEYRKYMEEVPWRLFPGVF
ncbi:MAG: isoprenylcysteine carboxylmethyltransferase family protein [Thermoplasmata archaeon]|nr:MAG: isoprenylcysteine carboxylmethyltransferase family protein [Thermoplasmata archaeon]